VFAKCFGKITREEKFCRYCPICVECRVFQITHEAKVKAEQSNMAMHKLAMDVINSLEPKEPGKEYEPWPEMERLEIFLKVDLATGKTH